MLRSTLGALVAAAGVAWLVQEFQRRKREKNWPLLVPIPKFVVAQAFHNENEPWFLLDLVEKYGPVFRLNFPFIYPVIVVADAKVSRVIQVHETPYSFVVLHITSHSQGQAENTHKGTYRFITEMGWITHFPPWSRGRVIICFLQLQKHRLLV